MEDISTLQIGMTSVGKLGGGVDRYYFDLLRALPKVGITTRGLVVSGMDAAIMQHGITSFARTNDGMARRWYGLRRAAPPLLKHAKLVVSHFAPYAFPLLDLFGKRPFVVHFHGPWSLESEAEGAGRAQVLIRRQIERAVYARAQRFIVLSQAFADILIDTFGISAKLISIVPGGVDMSRFKLAGSREEARMQLAWPLRRPTIVSVRRLVSSKGLEQLIDATVAIRDSIPDILVQIVGTGPLAESLQKRIEAAGLERNVCLTGHIRDEDLPRVYRAADMLIVPTLALEGFGLVVLESLACGTPVLVTPVGGLPEVVSDLDKSLILESSSAESIARGVVDAISGRITLPSAETCSRYANRFTWSRVAKEVGEIYREALRSRP